MLLLQPVLLHQSHPELHLNSEELHLPHRLLTEELQVMLLYTCLLLRQLLLHLQPPFQAPLLQPVLSSLRVLPLLHLQLQPVHLPLPGLRCHQPELYWLHQLLSEELRWILLYTYLSGLLHPVLLSLQVSVQICLPSLSVLQS